MSSFKSLIFGGSGAVGRELVDYLLNSGQYSKITLITRKTLERWEKSNPEKLNVITVESLDFLIDDLNKIKELIPDIETYNSVFNTLGGRVEVGEEEVRKIEYAYALKTLEICEKYNIPHFLFCSSNRADKNSYFLVWKVKGETEEELKQRKKIKKISVFHPGILLDRENDEKLGEHLEKGIHSISKIGAKDVAKSMFIVDLKFNSENNIVHNPENVYEVIENDEMIKLCEEK
jgi:hypothetical protein